MVSYRPFPQYEHMLFLPALDGHLGRISQQDVSVDHTIVLASQWMNANAPNVKRVVFTDAGTDGVPFFFDKVIGRTMEMYVPQGVVQLSLFRGANDATIFSFACYVRKNARYVNDKRGKHLELVDCVIAPTRFWYLQAGDVFDHNRFPHGLTVQVEARPDIRILLEPSRSL
ncbi:MAG: hypothetical protein K2W95_18425 [Candidatus Obscuribacterales bacterium]|nr:hypothetical protein [Candidatus Obscuribacterales bacterium]